MSMDVQFWYTSSSKLAGLPIQDGRIISLKDKPGYYYDQGGRRYRVNNVEFVESTEKLRDEILPTINNSPSSAERAGLIDLLYVTPDGIFKYDAMLPEPGCKTLLPVDVKEVPVSNRYTVYGRSWDTSEEKGRWSSFRWLMVCDEAAPGSQVSAIISNLVNTYSCAGIKIVGSVDIGSKLYINTTTNESSNTFYLDIQDAELLRSGTIDINTRENSTVRILGPITHTLQISGSGHVEIADSRISANINTSVFSGSLSIHDCVAEATAEHPITINSGSGSCAISGCRLTNCNINLPVGCNSLISNNILIDVGVYENGNKLDALYNNAGYNTAE